MCVYIRVVGVVTGGLWEWLQEGCGSGYRRVVGVATGGLWEWLQEGCGSGYRWVVGVATGGLWEWLQEVVGVAQEWLYQWFCYMTLQDFSYVIREFRVFYIQMPNGNLLSDVVGGGRVPATVHIALCTHMCLWEC